MLLSLVLAVIALFMLLTFLVGLILLIIGLLKKDKGKKLKKLGLIVGSIPIGIIVFIFLAGQTAELLLSKPNSEELVGIYHISKTTQIDIPKTDYNKYLLQFKEDGTFNLSPTPFLETCESGKYKLDYKWDYNELSFECPKAFTSAHIDRGIGSFQIEFIIGDPDSGESIFFKRVDDGKKN